MTDIPADTVLTIRFSIEELAAIDAWIARAEAPKPSREDAVRALVSGRLGAHGPSTMLPDLVTGRDIV